MPDPCLRCRRYVPESFARDPNNAMPVLLTLVLSLVGTLVARRLEPVILYPPPPLGFLQLQTRYRVLAVLLRVLCQLLDADNLQPPRLGESPAVVPSRHFSLRVVWVDQLAQDPSGVFAGKVAQVWNESRAIRAMEGTCKEGNGRSMTYRPQPRCVPASSRPRLLYTARSPSDRVG